MCGSIKMEKNKTSFNKYDTTVLSESIFYMEEPLPQWRKL